MKKVTLVLLFIAMTIAAFCQSTAHAHHLEIGKWDSYAKKWVYYNPKEVDLTITLYKTGITIDDASKTDLTIIKDLGASNSVNKDGNKCDSYAWTCYDERNRTCDFTMCNIPAINLIMYIIMYNDTIFRYYISNSTADNFN